MKSKNLRSLMQIALSVVLVISTFACGGGSSNAPPPPPPPAVSVTVSPTSATVQGGSTQQFTATLNNDPSNRGVSWTISPATGSGMLSGATSTSVMYTAPASAASNLNVTVTATSAADPSQSAFAMVSVPSISVTTSPTSATVQAGGTQQFTATVSNDPSNKSVTWTISPATGSGTLSNMTSTSVTYAAPASVVSNLNVTITATSVSDPTKLALVAVTVTTATIGPINFTSQNYPAGESPSGVAVTDFNGDGKLDIAVADYGNPSTGDNGGVSILVGNGDGTFQPANLINAGKNPVSIAVGDFNDDGKQDLLLANFGNRSSGGNGNLTVLLGNGDGTFQSPITLTAGPEPFDLVLGDFN
jgi:uncharacterized protein YjdB